MDIVRRSVGLAVILLSVCGVFICLIVFCGVWAGNSRLDPIVVAVFGTTDEALGFVGDKLELARQALDKSQERVSGLSRMAERIKNADAQAIKEYDPLLLSIDGIFDELKSAESWLDSSHAVATSVRKLSASFVSSDYAAAHPDAIGVAVADDVQKFSESLAGVLARLQAIRRELVQLRERGQVAHAAIIAVIASVADLRGKLMQLSAKIGQFDEKVATTRASCVALEARVLWWIKAAAVTLTIVLLWFGVSQIRMLKYGWWLSDFKPATTARQ